MPIIKSAKKRVKQTRTASVRNAKTKKSVRTALKAFSKSLGGKKTVEAHGKAQSALDTAAKKGIMHKNKVARKKAQLARAAKAAASAAPAKATAKKAPAKKTTTKAAAKPAAKKAAPKKTAAKKTTKK